DLRYGTDSSDFVGAGVEYMQSRPFVTGDPVRNIDWKVTARSGRYHVKQHESLKAIPIYFVVDTSASMAVSSQPFSKQMLAALLAGGLAMAGVRRLSPVGLLAAGGRLLYVKPTLSRARIYPWLYELRYGDFDEPTAVGQKLDELQSMLHSRSLVIVISDLHDGNALSSIKKIVQQHECIVLQLRDPAEVHLVRSGFVRGRESETGRNFISPRGPWYLPQGKPMHLALQDAGVDCLALSTDQPFVEPLRRFLSARGGILRNPR
ncbi:MAG: DUF58 domain-containing protein, partial [Planctomycetales bacterium]